MTKSDVYLIIANMFIIANSISDRNNGFLSIMAILWTILGTFRTFYKND